jgi:hypothetical protein
MHSVTFHLDSIFRELLVHNRTGVAFLREAQVELTSEARWI